MSQAAYSSLKAAWHLDKIQALRDGKSIIPGQVQLILSDLCNQDCIGEGTFVESPGGPIPVESISPGDLITAPDGSAATVIGTAWKVTDDLHEVTVGQRRLYLTGDHKILTEEGWKAVRELSGRDRVGVRLRMRPDSALEPPSEEVGQVRIRTQPRKGQDPVRREDAPSALGGPRSEPASVPMRLRETSEGPRAWGRSLLGGLSVRSSECRQDWPHVGGGQEAGVGTHEVGQPDAVAWSVRTGETIQVFGNLALKTGDEIRCVCDLSPSTYPVRGGRDVLGQEKEPGLQGLWATEGDRGDHLRNFQRPQHRSANRRELRQAADRVLPQGTSRVPGGLLPPGQPPKTSRVDGPRRSRVRVCGIELERGLGFRRVDSIRRVAGLFKVYDISCPPVAAFLANGLVTSNCHFCAYRMSGGMSTEQFAGENGEKNPKRFIPTAKAVEILHDCAKSGVKAVQFTGGGEPTVHPDHLHVFGVAQSLGLETSLVTNGIIFRDGWENVLPKMAWVRVSIDAGAASEYAAVRRVPEALYEKALANVEALSRQIELQGTACVLGCGYVLTRENWTDLVRGVERIRDAGARYVRLSAMFSTEGPEYYREVEGGIRERIALAKALETPTFKVVDLFGDRISDLVQHAPDYDFCGYQGFNVFIGGNLKIYRCCTTSYTKHGEVGDLRRQSFADWLSSLARLEHLHGFNARSCSLCQFNNQNRVISYLVNPEPLHVNFV